MIKNLGKVMQMVVPVIPAVVGGMQMLSNRERSQATQANANAQIAEAAAAVDIAQAQASENINAINANVAAYLGTLGAAVSAVNADTATYIADASANTVSEVTNLAVTEEEMDILSSLLDSILNW